MDLDHVVSRATADTEFRARLIENTNAALDTAGIAVPHEMEVSVLENTMETQYLVLPQIPTGLLDEEELSCARGGLAAASVRPITHIE